MKNSNLPFSVSSFIEDTQICYNFFIMVSVKVEFLGGLDVIVNSQRIHEVTLEGQDEFTVKDLINHIVEKMIANKSDIEVFLEDDTVRPGVLTLINNADWELEGGLDYILEDNDIISFISTLHGG